MDFEIDSYEFLPLREVVYLTLRKAILKEKLKPGDRLMENTIANKIGVSRTPVREAIRMLQQDGLVEMIPRKGAHVANISTQDLTDVLELRKSLERLALAKACVNITDDQIKELKIAEYLFEKVLAENDFTKIAEADEKFHDVIMGASGNKKLVEILGELREQMYRYRLEYLKQDGMLDIIANEHNEIIKAVSKADAKAAVEALNVHIDNQYNAIKKMLKERDKDE